MSAAGFPPGFLWGVATSAQQVEGAASVEGRGESVWDRYASVPGNIADGSHPGVACDHHRLWPEDLERMKWLGINAYRFSVAWPRVFPAGRGTPNARGLDFYDALVNALLGAGITPCVTLNHWDLPQALQDRGGWTSRDTVERFVEYADAVSARIGDRVPHWTTHNEPWCLSHLGYETGVHAPGVRDAAASLRVAHHLLLSHGRALQPLRRNSPGAELGIVHILSPVHAATDSAADRDAARQLDGTFNRWFLDPIFRGAYPADIVADRVRRGHLASAEPDFVRPGDLACIATPVDFLGVNYYSRVVVKQGADGAPLGVPGAPPGKLTDMGWEVYPAGLREILLRVQRDYAPKRVYVTENGAAYPDDPADPSHTVDPRRVAYLSGHLEAAKQAVHDGVPLRGYFVWSFMDNFEWGQGFTKRFGLFHVDFSTQARTARESAWWYRDWIARGLSVTATPQHNTRRTP